MGEEKEYTEKVSVTNYQASKTGVVALGVYLALMSILSFAMLINLMMADTGSDCCKKVEPANTNVNINANTGNTAQNSNADTNVNSSTVTNIAPVNSNTNKSANTNTAANKPANTTVANANTNVNAKTTPTTATQDFPKLDVPEKVNVWLFQDITADSFLLLIVLSAGMLGGLIRAMFSFSNHLGMGNFSFKWTWFYLLSPFTGGALSMILYLVIRGGFYSSSFGKGLVLNIFSFAALGALSGLFTENAMAKLKQVAEILLAKTPPKTPDSNPPAEPPRNQNVPPPPII